MARKWTALPYIVSTFGVILSVIWAAVQVMSLVQGGRSLDALCNQPLGRYLLVSGVLALLATSLAFARIAFDKVETATVVEPQWRKDFFSNSSGETFAACLQQRRCPNGFWTGSPRREPVVPPPPPPPAQPQQNPLQQQQNQLQPWQLPPPPPAAPPPQPQPLTKLQLALLKDSDDDDDNNNIPPPPPPPLTSSPTPTPPPPPPQPVDLTKARRRLNEILLDDASEEVLSATERQNQDLSLLINTMTLRKPENALLPQRIPCGGDDPTKLYPTRRHDSKDFFTAWTTPRSTWLLESKKWGQKNHLMTFNGKMYDFAGTGDFRKCHEAYAFSGVYSPIPPHYYDASNWLFGVGLALLAAAVLATLAWYGWLIYGTYLCSKSNAGKCVEEVYFSALAAVIANWVVPIIVAVLFCVFSLWSIGGSRWEGIND